MIDVLNNEEIEELLALRKCSGTAEIMDFYMPLSDKLQYYFMELFGCSVTSELPIFIGKSEIGSFHSPEAEGVNIQIEQEENQFLIVLTDFISVMSMFQFSDTEAHSHTPEKIKDIATGVYSKLGSFINALLYSDYESIVTPLPDEKSKYPHMGAGVNMVFCVEQKIKFQLTMYPSKKVAERISDVSFHDFRKEPRGYKLYDFKRPDKFTKEHVRCISIMHESFAKRIAFGLSLILQSDVQIRVASVDQLLFEEFMRSLKMPSHLGIVSMNPLKGKSLLEMDASISDAIINRIVRCADPCIEIKSGYTEIEEAVLKNIFDQLVIILGEVWNQIFDLRPIITQLETKDYLTEIVPSTEIVALITLEAKVGNIEGEINLCIPYITIEPILELLRPKYMDSYTSRKIELPAHIKDDIINTRFKRVVQFNCFSTSVTPASLLKGQYGTLPINSEVVGRYEYLPISNSNYTPKETKSKKEQVIKQEFREFIRNIPLPFELQFEDQIIDYNAYLSEGESSATILLSDFIQKNGTLFLGKTKIAEVILVSGNKGLSLKNVNQEIELNALALEEILLDTKFTVCCEMGVAYIPLEDILRMGNGSIIQFNQLVGDTLNLVIDESGYLIGKGEAIVLDGNIGIRVTEVTPVGTGMHVENQITMNVPAIRVRFIIGRTSLNLQELINLKEDSCIKFEEIAGGASSLVFDNGLVLEAEVVVIDENFGARVIIKEKQHTETKKNLLIENSQIESESMDNLKSAQTKIPFEYIRQANSVNLWNCIRMEHPQTIAVILSQLNHKKVSFILKKLPVETKKEVAKRLKHIDLISPMVLREIESILEMKLEYLNCHEGK